MQTKEIPVDGHGNPIISSEMKADCIGEFKWEEDWPVYDANGNLQDHVYTQTVPWTLCKKIYKEMAKSAVRHYEEAMDEK